MTSTSTLRGKKRHSSISVNTVTGSEHMRCGLTIERSNLIRTWRAPDCARCVKAVRRDR